MPALPGAGLPVALSQAGGGGESALPALLLLLTVAAVRREAQVGGSCQMFRAAVHLEENILTSGSVTKSRAPKILYVEICCCICICVYTSIYCKNVMLRHVVKSFHFISS